MEEQTIENSDINLGVPCKVVFYNKGNYIDARLYSKKTGDKKFADLTEDDVVYVLTEQEHQELLDNISKRKEYESEIKELDEQLTSLKEQNDKANDDRIAQLKKDVEYWKTSFKKVNNENESLENENENLKNENNSLTETNELLEDSNTNSKERVQYLQDAIESKEKELKETNQNHQRHIDEITNKYQSLLPLQEYVAPNQHFEEIDKLKDKIKASENELATIKADSETRLAQLQQELETKHSEDKAQLYVAYNNDLNNYKMQYNQLAIVYNQLVEDLQSLTRINTLLNGMHNVIKKNKEKVELLELPSETPSKIIEYVPKE